MSDCAAVFPILEGNDLIQVDTSIAALISWKERRFSGANLQMPLTQPPQRGLPKWGHWLETPRLIAICLPACQLQANITAPFDLVTTRLDLGEGIAAFGSESFRDYRAEPGGFDIIPRHCTYRSIETLGSYSLVLAFKQPLKKSLIAHQLGQIPKLKPGQVQPTAQGWAIAEAIHALFNTREGNAFLLESLANLALGQVVIQHSGTQGLPDRLRPAHLQRTLDYVHGNLSEKLSLEQLSSILKLSPTYFAHAFKATTGMTPHQYVLHCRVQHAREQLVNTNQSLAAIAYDAGFGSQSHMTTVFRRMLKVTPLHYRRPAANCLS